LGRIKRGLAKFLLNRLYRKLWVKLAAALVMIVSIPVLFAGFLLVNRSSRAFRESLLTDRREIVVRAAREINLFIQQTETVLGTTAAMLEIASPSPWQQETILVGLALEQPVFLRVTSFDLSARKIVSSDLGRDFAKDYAQVAIERVLNNNIYVSAIKYNNNRIPYLSMALALKAKGKITGVLMADIDFRRLWQIVDEIRFDTTGRAFLVSDDGTLIAHADKKRVLRNEKVIGARDVDAVLSGKNEAVMLPDAKGERWISAYAPIPQIGWGIVLRQKEEAFQ